MSPDATKGEHEGDVTMQEVASARGVSEQLCESPRVWILGGVIGCAFSFARLLLQVYACRTWVWCVVAWHANYIGVIELAMCVRWILLGQYLWSPSMLIVCLAFS